MLHKAPLNPLPKLASRAWPCFDQNSVPKKPNDGPWEPDKCHKAQCIGIGIIMLRVCFIPGITCGPGMYLKQKAEPGSPTDCCKCEKLP